MSSLATSNTFAALQQTKIKKTSKPDKPKDKEQKPEKHLELAQAIFSQPTLGASNWADDDDDDDFDEDDEWTQAKPGAALPVFNNFATQNTAADSPEESEEDEDDDHSDHVDLEAELGVEFAKSDDDEAHDKDEDEEQQRVEHRAATTAPQKLTPEQMLSKKQKKQKELDELNKVLAELGIDLPQGEEAAAAEGAKKKKKDKKKNASTENAPLETNAVAAKPESANGVKNDTKAPEKEPEDADEGGPVDPAAAKKALLAKKKAASKKESTSAAARAAAAAAEAKARAKKLNSKKDKSNYNQAPTR